jgi:hypothetical protein
MLELNGILISEDIIEKNFVCHLEKCKGECCKAGDTGAPLDAAEIPVMEKHLETVLPYLPEASRKKIKREGFWKRDDDYELVTNFHATGECVFVFYDEQKVLKCAYEKAYYDGKIDWKKPVSCHLYPIRVERLKNYTAMNYHKWDICKAACRLGNDLKVPIYKFVQEGIERKFGKDFYRELDKVAEAHTKKNKTKF